MTADDDALRAALRARRQQTRATWREIARAIEVNHSSLTCWLSGVRAPRIARRVAEWLAATPPPAGPPPRPQPPLFVPRTPAPPRIEDLIPEPGDASLARAWLAEQACAAGHPPAAIAAALAALSDAEALRRANRARLRLGLPPWRPTPAAAARPFA